MRLLKPLFLALFGLLASVGLAQIPSPQINLSGNIGCQGFPCFNVGTLRFTLDANRTMTAQESSAQSPALMTVTSTVSLTATRNLIAPAGRFSFTIENATTGGQSIQIIGPSGTGVTIPNGTAVSVASDGANFVQIGSAGGAAVASVSGASGNRAAGITPTTGVVVVTTFDQQLYASQYATIPLLITACGSAATKITVDTAQSFTLASDQTFPVNCAFSFVQGGVWTTGGAFTLTFNGTVDGNASPHFAGAATVKFGTLVTAVPVEWFGGKNDATGSVGVGTDNLAAFNAAVAAISAGQVTLKPSKGSSGLYRITGPVAIAKVNVGIEGVSAGTNGSTILIDSASADAVDVNPGAEWNTFRNFNIYRTQLATGTAAGLAIYGTSRPNGIVVDGVVSADSMYPFYMEGLIQFGPGNFINNQANWQVNGLVGSSPSGACGFFVDSTTFGAGYKTQFSGPNSATTGGTGVGLTGFCAKGDNISELEVDDFKTNGLDIGIDLENTGTSGYVAQSVHIINADLAPCSVACIKMNGVGGTADLGPHVYIQGGIIFATGSGGVGILAQNSTNISVEGVQLLAGSNGSAAQTDISLSAVDGFTLNDNQFTGGSLVNISCLNSTHGTIASNVIKTNNGAAGSTGIKMVGCTQTTIQGNTISGVVSGGLLTGISFDSGSSNNGPWSLNQIDATTVTTPVSDAGTNNNPSLVAGTNVTITGTWPNQTINATGGSQTWPTTPGITVCTGTPCTAWGTSLSAPAGAIVGTTDTQTLTNKTLTAPVIATIVNTGTLTLPTSTDTLVGRATTDALTNKTVNGVVLTAAGSSTLFLNQAGGYTAPTGGSGCVPSGTAGSLLMDDGSGGCADSHLDDGHTTAGTITSTEPVAVASSGPSQVSVTYGSAPTVGSSTTAVYAADSSGHAEVSEAAGAFSRLCTAANGVCASGAPAFNAITSGTNTTAAMVVGAGASLNFTSTGTINASTLLGNTWAAPGAIGGTTPGTGAFTTVSATSLNTGGLVKSSPSFGVLSTAVVGDVIALWTGSCSSSTFLRGDGACAGPAGSGTVTTSGSPTTGFLSLFTGATVIGNSPIDYNITTASTVTSTANIVAPVFSASTNILSPSFVNPAAGTATSGANFGSSGAYGLNGSYWTGTVSNTESANLSLIAGTGSNPTYTVQLAFTGSSGAQFFTAPNLIASSLGNSTSPVCPNGTNNALTTTGCTSGSSGLSGMTATQVPIAATATTVTSSIPINGAGAGLVSGPATATTGHVAVFTGAAGAIADGGGAAALLSFNNAFTGTNSFNKAITYGVTKFTTSGCSVSSTTGSGTAGIFTLGANSCTVVITINGATGMTAANGWTCDAHDRTAPTILLGGESSSTTTTASIAIPVTAGATDVISFSCRAF